MYLLLAGVGIITFVIVYKVFRKPKDAMEVCEMSALDPREILEEYCILRKDCEVRPQKAPGGMHSHKHPTPCIPEAGHKFPRSPDSEPYIIR